MPTGLRPRSPRCAACSGHALLRSLSSILGGAKRFTGWRRDNARQRVAREGEPGRQERPAIAQRDGHPDAGAAAAAKAWAGTRAERPASRSYSATSWPLKTSTSWP